MNDISVPEAGTLDNCQKIVPSMYEVHMKSNCYEHWGAVFFCFVKNLRSRPGQRDPFLEFTLPYFLFPVFRVYISQCYKCSTPFVTDESSFSAVTSEVISLRQQLAQYNGVRGIDEAKVIERANKLATANVSLQVRI